MTFCKRLMVVIHYKFPTYLLTPSIFIRKEYLMYPNAASYECLSELWRKEVVQRARSTSGSYYLSGYVELSLFVVVIN